MSTQRSLDQTDRLILYVVQTMTRGSPHLLVEGGGVLTTMLAKLLFLLDVWAMQTMEAQATDFRYIRYKHGPYPLVQFEERLDALKPWGLEATPKVTVDNGKRYRIYRLAKRVPVAAGLPYNLRELADTVMTTFGSLPLQDVLDHVYSLDCVRRVKFGDQIDLSSLRPDKEDSVALTLKLFRDDLRKPLPTAHAQAIERASKEASNENIQMAKAMAERQRKAFRQKYTS